MRTISLEFPTEVLQRLGVVPDGFFAGFEELELLETLRLEHGWRLQLLRLRRTGTFRPAADLARESRRIRRHYGLERFEVVEERPRSRDYVLLVRQKNPPWLMALLEIAGGEIAPTAPFLITAERTVASFHGTEMAVRRVLRRLDKEAVPYRVVRTSPSGTGARRDSDLTEGQRDLLARAWTLGFYAVPRRITLTRLARFTGRSPPALGKMLRRAEGRLVARYLAKEPPAPDPAPAKD
ncbi:MAG: helix-turn-helix domain-containing protein [Thermoplasmata archaeon]|nr:helix-turn-helix domain-containing protein [Thermoplasmata archaeon]